jgi:hypothetical protein
MSFNQCVVGLLTVLIGAVAMNTQHSRPTVMMSSITDSGTRSVGDDDASENQNDVSDIATGTRITSNSSRQSGPSGHNHDDRPTSNGNYHRQSGPSGHNHQDDRPIFTLHVGPPKTATSFLQCSFCADHTFTDEVLSQDGIVYLGTCPFNMCGIKKVPDHIFPHRHSSFFVKPALNSMGAVPHANYSVPVDDKLPELSPVFQAAVDRAHERHQNAVVIYEGCHKLHARDIAAIAHHLTIQNNWNVQIVVAYRRLYDWLPSKYNSITKRYLGGGWPDRNTGTQKLGNIVEDFHLDGRGEFSKFVRQIEETGQHPTQTVKQNYAYHFANVSVIDMRKLKATGSGDAYLEDFVCRFLPSAVNTCRAVREGKIGDKSKNPTQTFHYDILAVAAHQKGLYTGQVRRRKVAKLIQQRQTEELQLSVNDFPLQCFSNKTVDRLLNLSLKTEHNLFGEAWTEEQESEHRAGFAAALQKGKYCTIDTSKTLEDAGWQSFFRSLT